MYARVILREVARRVELSIAERALQNRDQLLPGMSVGRDTRATARPQQQGPPRRIREPPYGRDPDSWRQPTSQAEPRLGHGPRYPHVAEKFATGPMRMNPRRRRRGMLLIDPRQKILKRGARHRCGGRGFETSTLPILDLRDVPAAGFASLDVSRYCDRGGRLRIAGGVTCQQRQGRMATTAQASPPSVERRCAEASLMRDFTVPRGSPRWVAISGWLRSSK